MPGSDAVPRKALRATRWACVKGFQPAGCFQKWRGSRSAGFPPQSKKMWLRPKAALGLSMVKVWASRNFHHRDAGMSLRWTGRPSESCIQLRYRASRLSTPFSVFMTQTPISDILKDSFIFPVSLGKGAVCPNPGNVPRHICIWMNTDYLF
jgi:hypothetical protein